MNTTTYADGSKSVTYYDDLAKAVLAAAEDLKNPAVQSVTTARVDPYGPCPCGSGRKFKFCCRAKAK